MSYASPTTPSNWIDPLTWGTSSAGETTSTLGDDRLDTRIPPSPYHVGGLQITRLKSSILNVTQALKGGYGLRILPQSGNVFSVGQYGLQMTTGGLQVVLNGGAPQSVLAVSLTTKGDLIGYDGAATGRIGVGTNGQLLVADSTATYGVRWVSVGGDLSGTPQAATVAKIQGRAVYNAAPNNGDVLQWNNGTTRWEPSALTISINGLLAAYAAASGAGQNILAMTSTAGPVILRDNAAPIGTLFQVQSSGGGSTYFQINATDVRAGLPIAPLTDLGGYSVGTNALRFDAMYSRHFHGSQATAPTIAAGAAIGGAGAAVAIAGSDTAGTITITPGAGGTTGGGGGAADVLATITFNSAFSAAPTVCVFPADDNTSLGAIAQLGGSGWYYVQADTAAGSFKIKVGTFAHGAGTAINLNYVVIGR